MFSRNQYRGMVITLGIESKTEPETRIVADRGKCIGAAVCVEAAPDVFGLDEDDGLVTILKEFPGSGRSDVEEAVELCPVRALALQAVREAERT